MGGSRYPLVTVSIPIVATITMLANHPALCKRGQAFYSFDLFQLFYSGTIRSDKIHGPNLLRVQVGRYPLLANRIQVRKR